jgi:hypothetical protein
MYNDILTQQYTDLKIVVGGHTFHVHRLIICHGCGFIRLAVEGLPPGVCLPIFEIANCFRLSLIYVRTLTDSIIIGRYCCDSAR